MSGPRITSGDDSLQDAATPADFMAAIAKRFGEPVFDLAAHRGNKKCASYFAPAEFVEKFDPAKHDPGDFAAKLVARGARAIEASDAVIAAVALGKKSTVRVPNHDPDAYGFDAFRHDWAALSRLFRRECRLGPLWLNPEFFDIAPWATKCALEAKAGANALLLTPAVVTNWYRDIVAGVADVYECSGRLCFDGKNVFPKDCAVSHFWPGATGLKAIWDWRRDTLTTVWRLAA